MNRNKMQKMGILLAGLLLMSGCAQKSAEELVSERSQQQLDYLVAGEFSKAYDFTTPGYREVTTLGHFISRKIGAANWTNAEVLSVTCEKDLCRVVTNITYERKQYKLKVTKALNEKWLKISGKWYLYRKK